MNKPEPALIILIPGFPKDETDTICLPFQQRLVLELQAQNPNLQIIILALEYPYHLQEYKWFGITVIPFNGRNKGGLKRLLLRRAVAKRLLAIHNSDTITGLLSFWAGECSLAASSFGRQHAIPYYCWLLGQDARPGNKYISKINPLASELIALSDFIANEFERNYGVRPANLIPPGIDNHQFKSKVFERRIDILAAGSLIPLKRYDLLIEIVAGIRKQIPDIRVELCGAGPEHARLVGIIHSLGLEDNITLTGVLPHEILLERMQQCKLFLHPSSYEGFGIVCLEALHAGVTVISFVQPMKQEIGKWMIAVDKNDMINKSVSVLRNTSISYTSITPFTIQRTANSIAALFPGITVTETIPHRLRVVI